MRRWGVLWVVYAHIMMRIPAHEHARSQALPSNLYLIWFHISETINRYKLCVFKLIGRTSCSYALSLRTGKCRFRCVLESPACRGVAFGSHIPVHATQTVSQESEIKHVCPNLNHFTFVSPADAIGRTTCKAFPVIASLQ